MGCGCQGGKKKEAAAMSPPPASVKVRLINHSQTPDALVGKSTAKNYGRFKNGDRITIQRIDYEAEPEKFVLL